MASTAPAPDTTPRPIVRGAEEHLLRIARRAGMTVSSVSSLELIHWGDRHMARILDEISAARHEVAMEMYQIRPDEVGLDILAALAAAARRGVRVRLLLDGFGSQPVSRHLSEAIRAGVDVLWYNPIRLGATITRRTHRKLIVVDRRRASLGGMNLTAQFSERHAETGAWRDVSAWITGDAVQVLEGQFEAAWRQEGGQPALLGPIATRPGYPCALAGGADGRSGHATAVLTLLAEARFEVLLATPYFLPDRTLRAALAAAHRRGVHVVVMVPRYSDIAWFKHASRRLYPGLLRAGVEIWERCDRMVHAKVAVVDRRVAVLGSANLNRQSLHANSETMLAVCDPTVARELRAMIVDEPATAVEPLSAANWSGHPDRRRFLELVSASAGLVF